MYKIINDNTIKRISDNTFIPKAGSNADYEQFLNDIITIGQGCSPLGIGTYIEGETVGVTTDYKEARRLEYPPMQDQLDKIYHSGVNAWKADVKAIKDKYPKTQVGVTTVLRYPSWVDDEIYTRQTAYYISAAERLKEYRLLDGRPEVTTQVVVGTENVWDSGIGKTVTRNVYEDLPDAILEGRPHNNPGSEGSNIETSRPVKRGIHSSDIKNKIKIINDWKWIL